MKMKNELVIKAFLNREYSSVEVTENRSGSLYIYADRLMNYNTCLAQFVNNTLVINETKYSVTTSKIQSQIRRNIPLSYLDNVKYVDSLMMGTKDLTKFVEVKN